MKNSFLAGAFVLMGTALIGCAGPGYGAYYVQSAPPPPRYAVVGVAPGPGYVWTPGYWDYRGRNWAWREGAWMRPPRAGAAWVPHEWRREGGAWRFHRGYWR